MNLAILLHDEDALKINRLQNEICTSCNGGALKNGGALISESAQASNGHSAFFFCVPYYPLFAEIIGIKDIREAKNLFLSAKLKAPGMNVNSLVDAKKTSGIVFPVEIELQTGEKLHSSILAAKFAGAAFEGALQKLQETLQSYSGFSLPLKRFQLALIQKNGFSVIFSEKVWVSLK